MAIRTESYGDSYRRARLAAGLTQVQASQALGIDQRLLSKYECDDVEPSTSTLKRLAILYRVSLDDLLGMPRGGGGDGASVDAPGGDGDDDSGYAGGRAIPGYFGHTKGQVLPFPHSSVA